MNKLIIRGQLKASEVFEMVKEKVNNNKGVTMIEWVLLVILISGTLVLLKPTIAATFTKIAGLFDTIITEKINGIK